MTNNANLTAAQTAALSALRAARRVSRSGFFEAADLDRPVSGAALRALVAKGLAETASSLSRSHGWDVAAYRITPKGVRVAQDAGL